MRCYQSALLYTSIAVGAMFGPVEATSPGPTNLHPDSVIGETYAEYESRVTGCMLSIQQLWGDFFLEDGLGAVFLQHAHRDGIEICREALRNYFPFLCKRVIVLGIDPTVYVDPAMCLECIYYVSDGDLDRSQNRALALNHGLESSTYGRFIHRTGNRLEKEAEAGQ
jgi:hypothetical protein